MGSEQARDRLVAALVELTEHGIPADVQELLVGGNPDRRVRRGALSRVLTTAREQALREAAEAGLQYLADEKTVDEIMAAGDGDRLWKGDPFERIRIIGERKQKRDAAILRARAFLSLLTKEPKA